jgi:hypothetical protein
MSKFRRTEHGQKLHDLLEQANTKSLETEVEDLGYELTRANEEVERLQEYINDIEE